MNDLEIELQRQFQRIGKAQEDWLIELRRHGIDTNAAVLLHVERFALVSGLIKEVEALRAEVKRLQDRLHDTH